MPRREGPLSEPEALLSRRLGWRQFLPGRGGVKPPRFRVATTPVLTGFIRKEKIVKGKLPEKSPENSDLPCHEDLFASLKEMRLKLAQASNLPPFVIFHDRTLRAISQRLPQTTSELFAIKGCGEYKVSAYGNQTLEVVRAYLKRHPEANPLSGHNGSVAIRPVLKKPSGGSTVEITWMLWEKGGNVAEIA